MILVCSFGFTPQAMFEAVNKAYEFLCSRSAKRSKGADPVRVVLLLKTQAILFTRCAESKWRCEGCEGEVMMWEDEVCEGRR